ncbi:MAG: cupredoxin domain-containing protein [Geminicoccaceae bacterium]|nr:cupredoxin domain-containing protein [Geminicoccaceae bacterium]
MNARRILARTLMLALATTALATTGAQAAGDQGHADKIGRAGEAVEATRTIEVVMHDNYYEPETVNVNEGETVRFVLRNKGELLHEFNIGTAHMHEEHRAEMAVMMEHGMLEPDRINHEMMKMDMGGGHTMAHDDPNSVLLEPGQDAEIVWTFSETGDLQFACNIPGHYESGMVGDIHFGKGS